MHYLYVFGFVPFVVVAWFEGQEAMQDEESELNMEFVPEQA